MRSVLPPILDKPLRCIKSFEQLVPAQRLVDELCGLKEIHIGQISPQMVNTQLFF